MKEVRSVSLGYSGGSHGVSLRVMKGVSYRIGAHRGQIVKQDKLVQTSAGYFILTNNRLLFHPTTGQKVVCIPLSKILSYNCFENGIEIYKEGREKAFFFEIENSGSSEIAGINLGFLLEHMD